MKHETDVAYKGGLEKLAEDIGNLRYDALAKFLCALTCKLFNDSEKDRQRGREKLARRLRDAALKLEKATDNINVAESRICGLWLWPWGPHIRGRST